MSPKFNFLISSQLYFVLDSPCPAPLRVIWKPSPLTDYSSRRSLVSDSLVPSTPPLTAPGQAVCTADLDNFIHFWRASLCAIWLSPGWPLHWGCCKVGCQHLPPWRDAPCSRNFVTKFQGSCMAFNRISLHAQGTVTIWLCIMTQCICLK